jgi:hypothetical protein
MPKGLIPLVSAQKFVAITEQNLDATSNQIFFLYHYAYGNNKSV